MKIRGVIFDVDGVLLDSMPTWHDAGARFLKRLGIEAEEGLGDRLFQETSVSGAEYMIRQYDLDLTVSEVADGINSEMEAFYAHEADFKPGARELIATLEEEQIPMTVATSTDRIYIETVLKRLGVFDLFKGVFCCTDYQTTKSERKIFDLASGLMGTEPEETWLFEDGLYSIRTAKNAGYRTVGVYDRISERDQADIRTLADYYVRDLRDIRVGSGEITALTEGAARRDG
ncbi:MAG: HAD family hydrolase [Anaerovoracaceae bacterium]|jgi:HAD superfamily hydrolase (TIGR01509 family)